MIGDVHPVPPPIESKLGAIAFLEERVRRVETARLLCDVVVPTAGQALTDVQRKNHQSFLMHHGAALGTLITMFRLRIDGQPILSDSQYEHFRVRVQSTLQAGLVGGH